MGNQQFLSLCFTLCLMFIPSTNADSVFGCGGFVKSDVDINFSLVEVRSPVTSCSCRNVVVHSTTTTTTTYKNTNASCSCTALVYLY